jgi:hypothetical protein
MQSWSEFDMTLSEKKQLIDFRRIEALNFMSRGEKKEIRERAVEYVERGEEPGVALERALQDFGVPRYGGRVG